MKTIVFSIIISFLSSLITAQNISIEFFQNGFNDPLDLQNAGDDRLFVVEQGGRIKILNPDGSVNPTLFLNIAGQVSNGSEQGLLGLAFHPDYVNNGFYFVNYTKINGNSRIARFTVDPSDPDVTLSGSELTILEYNQPFSNHNGGGIVFGPDGYLYIASGDGGSSGDPGNRAQNTTLLLGKLLRIDVDNPSGGNNYGIPTDNPFAGSAVNAEEIWAYGLRNPWRFSFDSLTDDLWIGDVGQFDVEEIDKAEVTESGLNYGWRCYEGSQPFNTSGCPPAADLTFPIAEYSSATGSGNCSITGGIVYRGSMYTDIEGLYFFGDVCSGFLGTVDALGNLTNHGTFGGSWVGFGEDVNKELYVVSHGGSIFKIQGEILAIPEHEKANSIVLAPNPASENIVISIENDQLDSVSIIDLNGRTLIVEKKITTSEKSVNVSGLSQGLYIVRVNAINGRSFIKKLVIK